MGLFCLGPDLDENCTADELVEIAKSNIEIWEKHKDCDYLLSAFAISYLEKAAKKIKDEQNNQDLKDND